MSDPKIENLLELSLDVSEDTREKSENLSAGYDPEEKLWQVIIRYSGELLQLAGNYERVTPLLGGYAVLEVTEKQLRALAEEPQVEYIEKPKALSFAVYEGKLVSCIPPVQREPLSLTGQGILVGIIDSGIDIYHPDFRKEDGTTRIVGIWDQTAVNEGKMELMPPSGYSFGLFYSEEKINELLQAVGPAPAVDASGHGTHVAGIAAGNGRASRGENRGVAYESQLLIVKLGGRTQRDFPQTAELMQAIDFCIRFAAERNQPLALNLSYGNNYGSHTGTSLLETYLDEAALVGRTTICIGSGNEGNLRRHASGQLEAGREKVVEFSVSPYETSLSIQLWKQYVDSYQITLTTPSGSQIVVSEETAGTFRSLQDGMEILWYFGEPSPYQILQEIYLEIIPAYDRTMIQGGIWKLTLTPKQLVDGRFDFWMPSGAQINEETGFLVSESALTLTIPSTARRPITVAAYDANTDTYAPFSGRGYVCCNRSKPDLAAPGVDILSCAPGGGYTRKSGTSMACPFVTGSAALLMQYGIINGKDSYLYGQKVKAYLIRGARRTRAFETFPNDRVGWGMLCVADSIP